MQNLVNELSRLDADLMARIAREFAGSTEIIAAYFRECGFALARGRSRA